MFERAALLTLSLTALFVQWPIPTSIKNGNAHLVAKAVTSLKKRCILVCRIQPASFFDIVSVVLTQ